MKSNDLVMNDEIYQKVIHNSEGNYNDKNYNTYKSIVGNSKYYCL